MGKMNGILVIKEKKTVPHKPRSFVLASRNMPSIEAAEEFIEGELAWQEVTVPPSKRYKYGIIQVLVEPNCDPQDKKFVSMLKGMYKVNKDSMP